jgi:hypothetical protein
MFRRDPIPKSPSEPTAQLWLKDENLEDSTNLPDSDIIGAEIDS